VEQSIAITRQELLRLKKRLVEVRSGYRLLEQKRDSLIKTFMELKGEFLDLKEKLFNDLKEIIGLYELAIKVNPISFLDASIDSQGKVELDAKSQSIMGVKTTIFSVKNLQPPKINETQASQIQIQAIKKFSQVLPQLIKIASYEDALIKLASAIEKTRRRVNVLRDITIPAMQSQIKYINLKLADQERESLVFNLKFKKKKAQVLNN